MALVIKDRVKETTTTTGTGTYTLAGAEVGFQSFSSIGDGNSTYYSLSNKTGDWEVGVGTYTASGSTLARTTILSSSNGDNAVDWPSGEKIIFLTQPADKAVYKNLTGYTTGTEVETYLDFDTTEATKPPHRAGRLFYDEEYGALGFYNNEADITLQIGQEEWVRVYNDSGSAIVDGTPVYATGSTGEALNISPADATTQEKARVIGFTTHTIENSTYGFVTTRGLISNLNTSGFIAGSPIHLSPDGGFQNLAPTYPYFPTDLGFVVTADATNGYVYANLDRHSFEQLRVTGNQHVDGNLTVGGDLTILGTQTVADSTNIAIAGAFNYLNSGDTIGDANTNFTGTGLDDATFTGHYNGTSNQTYYVRISDDQALPDEFEWSKNNFATIEATGIPITGESYLLENNISIKFNAENGHDLGDVWFGTAAPSNVDSGIASNRNTGISGVGYTHIGMYYDVSSNKWTFFDGYAPEPEGEINTADPSFSYGTVIAGTFEGGFLGNLTGVADNATALETARTISLIGDVTGSVSFDGSTNANITATVVNDSHTHDTRYVKLAGDTMTGTLNVPTVDLGDWTISESGGSLIFQYNGITKFSMNSSGTMAVANDVETDATF